MKKCMLIALITVFTLVSVGALCYADIRRGVTNTSKKGSLLIYPLIKVDTDAGIDTIITLSNDYPGTVHMNCRFSDATCDCGATFNFDLTSGHPISWVASTGRGVDDEVVPSSKRNKPITGLGVLPGQFLGELRCWAARGTTPISWNHLSGTATIIEGTNQTWEYSAWRFAVGYAIPRNTTSVPADGIMRLTGAPNAYDACPEKLLFNFVKQDETPDTGPYDRADNQVTLVPCKQDCVSVRPTQVHIKRWDENEGSLDGMACLACGDNTSAFFSKSLSDTAKFGNTVQSSALALFVNIETPGGMFSVDNTPSLSEECVTDYGIPMVGVISNQWVGPAGPVSGETATTIGRGQPVIKGSGSPGIEVMMDPTP